MFEKNRKFTLFFFFFFFFFFAELALKGDTLLVFLFMYVSVYFLVSCFNNVIYIYFACKYM